MSGIGEAGLVLAAFPLVISALDQLLQGLEKLKDWWKIRRRYQNCKHSIEVEKLLFEENLEQLLSMLVHDDDELKRLIAKPGGKAWRDPELELGLQQRLPKSYNVYLSTIHKINGIMERLKHDLGVNVPAFQSVVDHKEASIKRVELTTTATESSQHSSGVQPTVNTKHKTPYQWQRIKFIFTTKTRTKHLKELAFHNSKLQKLLKSSDRLAASRQSREGRTQSQGIAKLTSFWRHAKTIYGLLRNAWRCECLPFHHANLLLQHWTDPEIELDILFVFSRDATLQKIGPWKCQRMKITEMMKEVSTAANDLDDSSTITDLCTTLASLQANSSTIGCLRDTDHQYFIYPLAEAEGEDASLGTVTLEDLLSKNPLIRLTRRQRYSIALTIASSHLQFYDSSWVGRQWEKKDVLFHVKSDNILLTDEPWYISKDFPTTPSSPQSSYNVEDHGISNLGIILLELSFDTPLEEHGFRGNLLTLDGEPNPWLDLAAAMQWCDRYAIDETGPELARVIDWCLRNRMTKLSGVHEQAWREELFTMVVEPLQNCYNQLVATVGDC